MEQQSAFGHRRRLRARTPGLRASRHVAVRFALVAGLGWTSFAPRAFGDEATAERAYSKALELVRTGDLTAARAAFETAYRESPHYVVLYNLARVCRDLNDRESEAKYLERYLEEGGERLSAAQREQARRELDELERARTKPGSAGAPVLTPPAEGESEATPVVRTKAPAPAAEAPSAAAGSPVAPATRAPDADALRRARWSGVSLALAATGGVLVGVGTGILIWNRGRYNEWDEEGQSLAAVGSVSIDSNDGGSSLRNAQALQSRANQNDALADSIRDFDTVGYVTLGTGIGLVTTSALIWLTAARGLRVTARRNGAELRFSF